MNYMGIFRFYFILTFKQIGYMIINSDVFYALSDIFLYIPPEFSLGLIKVWLCCSMNQLFGKEIVLLSLKCMLFQFLPEI